MKPAGYLCAKGEDGSGCGKVVQAEHWGKGECPRPPMPIPWIRSILLPLLIDTDHSGGKVSATRLLTCPRKVLIEDFIGPDAPGGGLIFDPRRMNSANFGNAVHGWMEKWTLPGEHREIRFPLEGQAAPELDFGEGVVLPVSGRVDFLAPDIVVLEDYKTHSESAHKFKWNRKSAEPELRAQFSIYKTLIERSIEGAKVKRGLVWHGAQTSARHPAPPWFMQEVPFMSLAEVGAVKPYGAHQSVRDIAKMYIWALAQIEAEVEAVGSAEWYAQVAAIINELPLVGEPIFGGQMCSTYCGAAQPKCFAWAGRPALL